METTIPADISVSKFSKIKNGFGKIFKGKNARRNIVVIILFLLAFGYVYYKYFGTTTTTTYEYTPVTVKDIKKTVEGSGQVVSLQELTIQQLQNGGKVTSVRVKPGDYVKQGQVIATLDNRSQVIQLEQAKANYLKVINGATPQTLDISKQTLVNAQLSYQTVKNQQDTAVANAKRNLLNTGLTAIPVYDSRIQPNNPTITGSYICDYENNYTISYSSSGLVTVTDSQGNSQQITISSVPQAIGNCGLYITFDSTKDYSNGSWNVPVPNKTSTNYSSNLNSYNSTLAARDQALLSASTTIINSQLSLNQTTVGSRPEDILSAKASLDSAQLAYDNTIITAPFDGQIGSVTAAVGQETNSQEGIATIITKDKVAQISLNEIDIVNVKLGQNVDLTFDAIPNETFKGTVSQIDTVGTQSSNVVSFAVKISIPNADERIKSGMSVTANIAVDEKDGVLSVPSATIKSENINGQTKYYVMRKKNSPKSTTSQISGEINDLVTGTDTSDMPQANNKNSIASGTGTSTRNWQGKRNKSSATGTATDNEKVYVTVGITNDIDTEIVEGLNEGDQVVSKTTTGSATTKSSSTSIFSLFGGGATRGAGGFGGGGGGGGGARPAAAATTGR